MCIVFPDIKTVTKFLKQKKVITDNKEYTINELYSSHRDLILAELKTQIKGVLDASKAKTYEKPQQV